MRKKSAIGLGAATVVALLGIAFARLLLHAPMPALDDLSSGEHADSRNETGRLADLRAQAWREAIPIVDACQDALEKELHPLVLAPTNAFFDASAGRASHFADHLLSFSGKWKFMTTRFDGGDPAYNRWVSGQVKEKLVDFADLEKLLEHRIARFIQEIEARENQLLLQLERDLLARPEFADFQFPSGENLHDAFNQRTEQLAREVGKDFAYDVGGLVATEIAAVVIARVATRLLVSGGILSTGAALSPESLGLTLVAAVAIDAVVSTIMNWISGSKSEITGHLKDTLYDMRNQIVWGRAEIEQDGLLWELRLLSRDRARIRQQAIEELINNPGP